MAFCRHCGQHIENQSKFCSHCGQSAEMTSRAEPGGMDQQSAPVLQQAGYQLPMQPGTDGADQVGSVTQAGYQIPSQSAAGAAIVSSGYSTRTQEPAFSAFTRKQKKYSWIFLAVLGVAALIAIFVFAREELGMALLTWAVVISLIAVFNVFGSRKEKKSWDGVLEDKKIVTQYDRGNEHHARQVKQIPTLTFRTSEGKREKVQLSYNNDVYGYYQIGDQVRKHPHFEYPEKHHKGERVICLFCGKLISRDASQCPRCKLMTIV